MVTHTPVLYYYNLKEEVTLQCDASQSGLGGALMQNGQPIAYTSRALTLAETLYAQIDKLLAIVFACDCFDAYIHDRVLVKYKKGRELLLADTLSHAYLPEVNPTEFLRELQEVDQRT